jgi:hypothetical protein
MIPGVKVPRYDQHPPYRSATRLTECLVSRVVIMEMEKGAMAKGSDSEETKVVLHHEVQVVWKAY